MQRRLSDAEVAATVGGRRRDQSLRCFGAGACGCDGEKSEREDGESASSERQSGGHADEERDEKLTAEEEARGVRSLLFYAAFSLAKAGC